jgi:hypothetical protein
MAIDPLSIATAAGISALSPVVAKGIGSLFGLDEPSEEEQRAARLRQEALDRLTAQAEGRTSSPAQLAALAQQQRTQQALQSLAQRGTVQQRAGNVRAAMQAAPEVMAQQGAVAAQTRAAEMESARNALAQMQMASASQEAAAGRANREYMQRLIGAGVSGGASAAAMGMMQGGDETPKKPAAAPAAAATTTATSSQGLAAVPGETMGKKAGVYGATPTPVRTTEQAGSFQLQPQRLPSVGYQAPSVSLGASQMQLQQPTLQLGRRARGSIYGGTDPFAGQYQLKGY